MADNEVSEIGYVEKNSRTRFYVNVTKWREQDYCDIREYYIDDNDEWKPTKKGVRLSAEFLPELIELLKKVSDQQK